MSILGAAVLIGTVVGVINCGVKPTCLRVGAVRVDKTLDRDIYLHYYDIRDTDIPETKWRRSFSINQFLYGIVLYLEKTGDFESFDQICENLKKEYATQKKSS